ncbi:MAG: phosphotransferase family protein [Porticoccaceae bacterium]|nr:phosphotransferase family protein [Pseudomonadales bacterium]MCP5172154.1 phosphotransferase family protein [Pseudomonadales bacterium]
MSPLLDQAATLRSGLEIFLSGERGCPVTVSGLKRLTGGTSHETWAFDLHENNQSDVMPLVLRRDFSADVLDLELGTEFSLLQALYDDGIPVPRPLYCVQTESPIETPFMISERLDGKDIRKEMAANPERAVSLGERLTDIQASVHAIDWKLLIAKTNLKLPENPAAYQVDLWTKTLTDNLIEPEPMLSYAASWLECHLPHDVPLAMIHGDFKANNLLFDSNGRIAVIDWELAHVGDPYEDLAFTLLWTTRFDIVGGMLSREAYLHCYEKTTGQKVDPERLFYWQVFAWVKLAAIFLKGFCEDEANQSARPARIMLVRAIPWISVQLGKLFAEHHEGQGVKI